MPERPHNHPPTDNLAALGEAERDAALCRVEALLSPSPTRRDPGRGSQSSVWSGARRQKEGATQRPRPRSTRSCHRISRSLSDSRFGEGERQRLLTIEDESIKNNL